MECASDVQTASPFIFVDRRLFNAEDNNLDLIQVSEQENMGFSLADINLISDLAASGPEGLSAAAAIVSMKKHRVHHNFESDPFKRRRKKTQLLRKLRRIVQDYISKFGGQVVFMAVSPGFNGFKIFGTDALMKAVIDMKIDIMGEFKTALDEETFYVTSPKYPEHFPLPRLIVDGLPATIDKMTQSQLRAFIPQMIKCSTKRNQIGWGNAETKPVWWPDGLPWANIRSDMRHQKEKKRVSWSNVLRQIVIACYRYHGKERFLYSFSKNNPEESTCDSNIASSFINDTVEMSKCENLTEQENQNQNFTVDSKDSCECTNIISCVEETKCDNDSSEIFVKNETTTTETCERVDIPDAVATTENINDKEDGVETVTTIVECTTKIENVNSNNINEPSGSVLNQNDKVEYVYDATNVVTVNSNNINEPSGSILNQNDKVEYVYDATNVVTVNSNNINEPSGSILNQNDKVEYAYDATNLVTVDANNAIYLDLRGCTDGQLTYVIPLVRVQPVRVSEGETFAFAQNDMATHSLVVQVNENDNLFLN